MRELMTAINRRKVSAYMAEQPNIKVLVDDIEYQEELFTKLATHDPDVLLLLEALPGALSKRELCEELLKLNKSMKIIYILNDPDDAAFIRFLKDKGIKDYFSLSDDINELIAAVIYEDQVKEEVKEIVEQNKQTQIVQELDKKPKKIFEIIPEDYKRIIGIMGGHNTGKSELCVFCSKVISSYDKKVAIVDVTKNQNLKFYFYDENEDDENSLDKNKYIKVYNNIHLYPLNMNQNLIDFIDEIEDQYDVVILDLGSDINKEICRYIDKLYMVTDGDISHTEEINGYFKLMNEFKISLKKCRLIYNKVLTEKYIKDLKDISKYDFNTDQDGNINKSCDENIKSFNVKFITDEKIYDKIINFDIGVYKKDEVFREQIEAIAKDMYPVLNTKTGIGGKIKKIFKHFGGR